MFEQDSGIASIIFQDLMVFQLRIDWFRSFWLEVNVFISNITAVFELDEIFVGFISSLVVDCNSFIYTHCYEWCINYPILVNPIMMGSFSFQKLEGGPRKR